MSKIYFVMNNREDSSKGYTEVSEEFVKNYIASFPEGERAYFINLGYAIMETDEENYRSFYKEARRNKYVTEQELWKHYVMLYKPCLKSTYCFELVYKIIQLILNIVVIST